MTTEGLLLKFGALSALLSIARDARKQALPQQQFMKDITNGPSIDWMATHNETSEQRLAKIKAYANEHLPNPAFYDATYVRKIEALRMEQFRTLVDYVRPLIDQLPLEKLISELAETDAFRGWSDFEQYLANEIILLGTVRALFRAANDASRRRSGVFASQEEEDEAAEELRRLDRIKPLPENSSAEIDDNPMPY